MLILIEGNIASGKSTITDQLAGVKFDEPLINFLPLYYQDPRRWGFSMQVTILTERYKQWKLAQAICLNDPTRDCILDRSLFHDHTFARLVHKNGNMDDNEYDSYCQLHSVLQEQIYFPDLCIWLRAKPETCLERLKVRARGCECNVQLDYLQALELEYQDAMKTFAKKCPVVEVNAEGNPLSVLSKVQHAILERKQHLNDTWPHWKGGL